MREIPTGELEEGETGSESWREKAVSIDGRCGINQRPGMSGYLFQKSLPRASSSFGCLPKEAALGFAVA